jgi:ribulose-bisphosphate carboxylase large chain
MKEPIIAKYLIETAHPVEFAAEVIAGEQSSGTSVSVPGETEELKARARAKVTKLVRLDSAESPSLPGSRLPKNYSGTAK